MRKHKVKVRYTFDGYYYIMAESKEDAERIASEDCGLVIGGGIHTSDSMHVKDWEFDVHSYTKTLSAKQIKQSAESGE